MYVQRQIAEMEMLKQAFSGILEDDDVYAERKRLLGLAERNSWPNEVFFLIENTVTDDVMALGGRIARAEADGEWDTLFHEAMAEGVPGIPR